MRGRISGVFTNPLIVDENNTILAGHARWEAAKQLGLEYFPVILITQRPPATSTGEDFQPMRRLGDSNTVVHPTSSDSA